MTKWKTLLLCAAAMMSSAAVAQAENDDVVRLRVALQQEAEEARRAAEREARRLEQEERRVQQEVRRNEQRAREERRQIEREVEREVVDIEREMRRAESRLAEAARRVAELSSRQLPQVSGSVWSSGFSDKPVLGVTIGEPAGQGPVEGVEVLGVSPGGPAAEAGLRAGDVITAINSESLSADDGEEANRRLLDFMTGVEEGDVLDVEYLRAGRSANAEVKPRAVSPQVFSFGGPGRQFRFEGPSVRVAPDVESFVFVAGDEGWGDMEMVKLTEGLGRYFGTEEGMLVVRAPENEKFELQDGDVILDIDGRSPNSVSHAIRILGSYQSGEKLKIRIMRDKRKRTLEVEMPENRRGSIEFAVPPAPEAPAPVSPVVVVPDRN